jgi:hypothetical protein
MSHPSRASNAGTSLSVHVEENSISPLEVQTLDALPAQPNHSNGVVRGAMHQNHERLELG